MNRERIQAYLKQQPKLKVIQTVYEDIIRIESHGKVYFIIFEDEDIYTKFLSFEKLQNNINLFKQDFFQETDQNVIRIPFFAGCSRADLEESLNTTLNNPFEVPIYFDTLPVDFNIYGLDLFFNYLQFIKNRPVVSKGKNNIIDYQRYFLDLVGTSASHFARYLPSYLLEKDLILNTDDPIFEPVIERLKGL